MSALRVALVLLLGCAHRDVKPANVPSAPLVKVERTWTEVLLSAAEVYDWGRPIYVGVRIVRPPLAWIDEVELAHAAPVDGDELRFLVFADDGRIVRTTCKEPGGQRVKATVRRRSDMTEGKTVRRLDRCLDMPPGRYWIAGIYGPHHEARVRFSVLHVRPVISSCQEEGSVWRCSPGEPGRFLEGLASVTARSPAGPRSWDVLPLAP